MIFRDHRIHYGDSFDGRTTSTETSGFGDGSDCFSNVLLVNAQTEGSKLISLRILEPDSVLLGFHRGRVNNKIKRKP